MELLNTSTFVPLTLGSDSVIRIVSTRVTLESVVQAFKNGSTAEEIAFQYTVLDLSDVYAVISYYLKNQSTVEKYMNTSQLAAEEIKSVIQEHFQLNDMRQRLMTRQSKRP